MIRTSVTLSIEEIELLLDLLGVPQNDDSPEKKHLRERLQETIQFLREKSPHSTIA